MYRAYMQLLQREVTQLLCECGYGISCGLRREGKRLGFLMFNDAEQASETYGEQVAYCPGCATQLDYRLLLPKKRGG